MDRAKIASGRWPPEWLEFLTGDAVELQLDFYEPPTVGQLIDRCLTAGRDEATNRTLTPIRELSRSDRRAGWLVTRGDARHLVAVYAGVEDCPELGDDALRDLATSVRFRDDLLSIMRVQADTLEPVHERHIRFATHL
jgi:hypothetical protein